MCSFLYSENSVLQAKDAADKRRGIDSHNKEIAYNVNHDIKFFDVVRAEIF